MDTSNSVERFESRYRDANSDASQIPWARLQANNYLTQWLDANPIDGKNKKAQVGGCGLGDDAEFFTELGFAVTSFDFSPTAIEWVLKRFPDTAVSYHVADLLDLPPEVSGPYDFIYDGYLLHCLDVQDRPAGIRAQVERLAPGGIIFAVERANDENHGTHAGPTPMRAEEFNVFTDLGLTILAFDLMPNTDPWDRHRGVYRKDA